MKRGTPNHPKVAVLMALLRVRRYVAVGMLESLWHFTMRYAPTGDIGKWSDEEIARGIDYRGDAQRLIEALIVAKWLRESDAHRLIVHDWHEHADQTTKRYLAAHKLAFASQCPANNSPPVPVPEAVPAPAPGAEAEPSAAAPHQEIREAWNAAVSSVKQLRAIRGISDRRQAHLRARWQEPAFRDNYARIFEKAVASEFFRKGGRTWATFDWLIKNDDNYAKVLEGRYDNEPTPTGSGKQRQAGGTEAGSEDGEGGKYGDGERIQA